MFEIVAQTVAVIAFQADPSRRKEVRFPRNAIHLMRGNFLKIRHIANRIISLLHIIIDIILISLRNLHKRIGRINLLLQRKQMRGRTVHNLRQDTSIIVADERGRTGLDACVVVDLVAWGADDAD